MSNGVRVQDLFPSKESAEKTLAAFRLTYPEFFEQIDQARANGGHPCLFAVRDGPGKTGGFILQAAQRALRHYEQLETATTTQTTTTTTDENKSDQVMSGHSGMNKRVYAPRPQTAPPGCKDKTGVVPLPPSQASPLLLPKGNSNPGEEKKKKQKALIPLPKKSLAEPEEEDLDLDPDMAVWELNRNSPRKAIIHSEQETRRPTTPTPETPKIAAVV